ncbi:MAG: copper-binding protein, partial [Pseudomonadota bacterium]
MDVWGLAAIAAKWALYVGVLGAAGTVLCALLFRVTGTRGVAGCFAALGLAAGGLSFMLKGVALTGDASGLTDPEMLGLLWGTRSGTALALQAGGLATLLIGLALGSVGRLVAALVGLVALGSFAALGLVADRVRLVLSGVLLLHLSGLAVWIG